MKKSRHNSASLAVVSEETLQDNNTFWSEYWDYFPRMGINPSSLFESAILAIAILFTIVIYTVVYLVYMGLRMLIRNLRG